MLWEECNMRTKIHHFGKTPLGGWLCHAMPVWSVNFFSIADANGWSACAFIISQNIFPITFPIMTILIWDVQIPIKFLCLSSFDISQIIGKFGIHPISKWCHFPWFRTFRSSLKGSITHQRESTSTNQADDLGWGWGRPRPHGDEKSGWMSGWSLAVRSLIPMNPYTLW